MDCGCGPFKAYCDMEGNCTVFQRRFNGAVGFYRSWNDYVNGFGSPRGEYWLGLKHIHCMTNTYPGVKLIVNLEDWEDNTWYAEYSHFAVGDSTTDYKLTVWGHNGTAGDRLFYHNGNKFSTYDRDNDKGSGKCAVTYRGGWWYNTCHKVNLNGEYLTGGVADAKGVTWDFAKPGASQYYSFRCVEMKIMFKNSK